MFRGWSFSSREHMLPVYKMHFLKKLQKFRKKSSLRASRYSICSRSRFTVNRHVLNFDANKRFFTRHCFVFFTQVIKNIFFHKTCCTHIKRSRCTHHIFTQIFFDLPKCFSKWWEHMHPSTETNFCLCLDVFNL